MAAHKETIRVRNYWLQVLEDMQLELEKMQKEANQKPGAQPGHKGHCRKRQKPTQPVILLPPPEEVHGDSAFKKTSKTIVKQLVSIRMILNVTEYHADVYYNSQTGERVHACFDAPGRADKYI